MASVVKKIRYCFLGALILGAVFVWYAVISETRNGLEITFLDIGQGDAIFIRAPNGNQVLVDGGSPNKAVLRELSKVMPFYDKSIDVAMLTHNHLDHYGGLNDVLAKYKIKLEMDSGTKNRDSGFVEFEKLLKEKNTTRVHAKRGMRVNLSENIHMDILLPIINDEDLSPHDGMLVSRLVYKDSSFLLTGDMEENLENFLLWVGGDIKSDVLKVGHHGSKTSTSEKFLGNVNPGIAVISAGRNNKYGHPHEEVVERLSRFKVSVLRTDEKGIIKLFSDGSNIRIKP